MGCGVRVMDKANGQRGEERRGRVLSKGGGSQQTDALSFCWIEAFATKPSCFQSPCFVAMSGLW